MDFKAPFSLFFSLPNKGKNWLFLTLCFLIPVVGPIVAVGWLLRCFVAWLDERQAPEFDFQYFGDYLKQGLWPTLVQIVIGMAIALILVPVFLIAIFAVLPLLNQNSPEANGLLIVLLVLALIAVEVLLITVVSILIVPSVIRSGLRQDFASGFSLAFTKGFLSRCWKPLLLAQIGIMIIGFVAVLLGCIALFIGVYFAMSLLSFVNWHLHYQVYRTYLDKGGEPIPVHPSLRPPAPPPVPA